LGLEFDDYYGDEWEKLVEKRFNDWAMLIFGGRFPLEATGGNELTFSSEKNSSKRSVFTLSKAPSDTEETTATASSSQASRTEAVGQLTERPLGVDITMVDEDEMESGVVPLPQISETTQAALPPASTPLPQISETTQAAPPPASTQLPLVNQPLAMTFQYLDENPEIFMPQDFETSGFVVPQEMFPLSQSLGPTMTHPVNIPLVVTESHVVTPTVAGSPQPVTPNQVVVSSVAHRPPHLVAPPVLESSQALVSNQTTFSPIVLESASLVVPVLVSSQVATPNHTTNSAVAHGSLSLVTPPLLESSQAVTPNQVVVPPVVCEPPSLVTPPLLESSQVVTPNQVISPAVPPLVNPSGVLGSSQAATLQQVVSTPSQAVAPQRVVSAPPPTNTPHVVRKPQPAVMESSSGLMGGNNSGITATAKGVYRPRDKVSVATTNRTRRDSIEGVPDIVLSLGGSGYELADALSLQVPIPHPTTPSSTASSTTPSTPSPEFIVPSSQRSLEEELSIPSDIETVVSTPTSVEEREAYFSQPPVEESMAIPVASGITAATSGHFHYAPRVIPTYSIDRSDLPSWLTERGRLDYVLSVEAGELWRKLIATWLRQERRLGFGLNEQIVSRSPRVLRCIF
jgi:hypothetical protein